MTKKIFVFICVCFLALPLIASAEVSGTANTRLSNKLASTSAAIKGALARCPVVESKIQVKSTNFDNSKVKHLEAYAKVKDRLVVIVDKLAAKGVDVTSLRATLVIYDQKIQKFSDDYAIYIGKLKESQVYVCGKSEGQFRTKLKEAKTALAQVHKDAVDIRTYYAQTIKPEINKIRATIRGDKSTSTPTTTESLPVTDANNN
jgi:hypothetical protein